MTGASGLRGWQRAVVRNPPGKEPAADFARCGAHYGDLGALDDTDDAGRSATDVTFDIGIEVEADWKHIRC